MSNARRTCKNASVGRVRRRCPDATRPRERRRVAIDTIPAAEYVGKTPSVFHRSTGVIEGCAGTWSETEWSLPAPAGAWLGVEWVELTLKPRAATSQPGLPVFDAYCNFHYA